MQAVLPALWNLDRLDQAPLPLDGLYRCIAPASQKELHALNKQHGSSVIVFVDCLLEALQIIGNTWNVRTKELPALSWPGHFLRAQPAFLASSF